MAHPDTSSNRPADEAARPASAGLRADAPGVAALDDEMRAVLDEFLAESAENLDRVDAELLELEGRPDDAKLLSSVFRTLHTIKGTCGFFGFDALQRLTHGAETLLDRARAGDVRMDAPVADALLATVDAVRAMLGAIAAMGTDAGVDVTGLGETLEALASGGASACAASVAEPDAMASLAAESAPNPGPCPASDPASDAAPDVAPDVAPDTAPEAASRTTLRVDTRVLDALLDRVGELVLGRDQLLECIERADERRLPAAAQRLHTITAELQDAVMATRMQPIDVLWGRLPRVVRDLARRCAKRVDVQLEGRDTELDRTLLDALRDPLVHLVRNCIDHGIEAPEARVAAGKPPVGRLSLRARHEGGRVHIDIADDGAGIDPVALGAKAVASGVLRDSDVAALDESALLELVFLPGLSTAAGVTEVSGRGVGMDVVRNDVQGIGGTIEIDSVRGAGTTFRIRVPLTLAIVPALIVGAGDERFAIPQAGLVELLRVGVGERGARIEDLHGVRVLRLREALLPLVDLAQELGMRPAGETAVPDAGIDVAVLASEGRRFALVVERVHDTREIVVKPLVDALRAIGTYAGAALLGDGRPALVLDVHGIGVRARLLDASLASAAPTREGEDDGAPVAQLLFAAGTDGRRLAVPLTRVVRLERVSERRVERAAGMELCQYRGGLLRLVHPDSRAAFAEARGDAASDVDASRSVIVVGGPEGLLGLCVNEVLDIADAAPTTPSRATDADDASRATGAEDAAARELAVADGRVAELVDVDALLQRFPPPLDGVDVGASVSAEALAA